MRPWTFFPDFTAGSPYQDRLAEMLTAHGWTVRAGDIAAAAQRGAGVFHIGWEQPVYLPAPTEREAAALAEGFLHRLDAFRSAGGITVWTMHNAVPHEERFPAVNAALQQELARRIDIVHVHNQAGAAHAVTVGVPRGRVLLARHPSYGETYPNDITDDAARRYLSLAPEDIVFAFFGAMRAYKGVARLLRAFDVASAAIPRARLVLAGRSAPAHPARLRVPNPRLRLLQRDIADAEVQYVLRAADCVVLPYEAVLTSGALALAQAFARPVIVPNLPPLMEEVVDGHNGFVFQAGDDDALTDALWRAADSLPALRGAMRDASAAAIAGRDFAGLAAALAQAVETALPARRAA